MGVHALVLLIFAGVFLTVSSVFAHEPPALTCAEMATPPDPNSSESQKETEGLLKSFPRSSYDLGPLGDVYQRFLKADLTPDDRIVIIRKFASFRYGPALKEISRFGFSRTRLFHLAMAIAMDSTKDEHIAKFFFAHIEYLALDQQTRFEILSKAARQMAEKYKFYETEYEKHRDHPIAEERLWPFLSAYKSAGLVFVPAIGNLGLSAHQKYLLFQILSEGAEPQIHIASFGFGYDRRKKIAIDFAEAGREDILPHLKLFVLKASDRYEVYQRLRSRMATANDVVQYLKDMEFSQEINFQLVNEFCAAGFPFNIAVEGVDLSVQQKLKLVESQFAAGEPTRVVLALRTLELDPQITAAIGERLAALPKSGILDYLNYFPESARVKIAKIYAGVAPETTVYHFHKLKFSQADRGAIAKIVAQDPSLLHLAESVPGWDLSPADRFSLALTVLPRNISLGLASLPRFKLEDAQQQAVRQSTFILDPLGTILALTGKDPRIAGGIPETQALIVEAASKFPLVVTPELVHLLYDTVRKQEVGLKLLQVAMKLLSSLLTAQEGTPVPMELDKALKKLNFSAKLPKDSLDLFSLVVGADTTKVRKIRNHDALALFMSLALDIQLQANHPVLRELRIDESLLRDRKLPQLSEYLLILRNLRDLKGGTSKAWAELLQRLSPGVLNADNVGAEIKKLKDLFVKEVNGLFMGENLEFKYEQFEALEGQWGDLDPVKVLLSRFAGNPLWKNEIALLARVFDNSLKHHFSRFKFFGDRKDPDDVAAASAQMKSLKTPAQVREWATSRATAVIFDPAESTQRNSELVNPLVGAKVILETNLMPNSGFDRAKAQTDQKLQDLFLGRMGSRDLMTQAFLIAGGSGRAERHVLDNILLAAEKTWEAETFKKYLVLALSFLEHSSGTFPREQKEQLKNDLTAMLNLFSASRDVEGSQKGIVLTVVSHDPKFLLTIGDLVRTSSCQNFRTGTYIQSLLGYVVDANVQGMASFKLRPSDFKSEEDYLKVERAIQGGQIVANRFDGNKRIASFTLADGVKISTKVLDRAFLRRIVKLGTTASAEPGIAAEREYVETYGANPDLKKQHEFMRLHMNNMFAELALAIGAKTDQTIEVMKTRNIGGQYSDAAKGIQTGTYKIIYEKP